MDSSSMSYKVMYDRIEKKMEQEVEKSNRVPLNYLKAKYGINNESLIRIHYCMKQIRMQERFKKQTEEAKEQSIFDT